jgi:HTH-type transcriptional regulator/antitoxin HigA
MKYTNQSSVRPGLFEAWGTLQELILLRPIRSDADFERLHALADSLSDEVGDDENHPLFSLFEIVMDLIDQWEESNVEIQESDPKEVLRFFLDQNNLRQKDLAHLASPALISDILAGRRNISKELAKNLAGHFNVGVSVFL